MKPQIPFLIAMWMLVACAGSPTDGAMPNEEVTSTGTSAGETAYLEHCAGCHETGMLGAPIVGDESFWNGRSNLWQAVLMEHANDGYFDMPAKGGRPELPDATIDAAVRYMLSVTYPDRPEAE